MFVYQQAEDDESHWLFGSSSQETKSQVQVSLAEKKKVGQSIFSVGQSMFFFLSSN